MNSKSNFSTMLASRNLAESDLEELARAVNLVKLVEIIKANPEMGGVIDSLVSDLGEGPDAESLLLSSNNKSRRFSLQSLPPDFAAVMSLFDFDGNGKVTLEEVKRGAELLKETKQKQKIALWALVIQFLVYVVLTALSCGILYHLLYLMKDTSVDAATGTLLVKDSSGDSTGKVVEVSVKSHGTSFSYDTVAVDSATGKKKGCIHGSKASEMFNLITTGAPTVFVDQDTDTGDVNVVSLGTNGASWTNTTLNLGEMVLIPDADCTQEFLMAEESISNQDDANPGERRSLISRESLLDGHLTLREELVAAASLPKNAHGASNNNNGEIDHRQLGPIVSSGEQLGYTVLSAEFTFEEELCRHGAMGLAKERVSDDIKPNIQCVPYREAADEHIERLEFDGTIYSVTGSRLDNFGIDTNIGEVYKDLYIVPFDGPDVVSGALNCEAVAYRCSDHIQ